MKTSQTDLGKVWMTSWNSSQPHTHTVIIKHSMADNLYAEQMVKEDVVS